MGRAGSGPEFLVNFGLGRVGSLHLWIGLGRVKKIGPTSNSALSSYSLGQLVALAVKFESGLNTGKLTVAVAGGVAYHQRLHWR